MTERAATATTLTLLPGHDEDSTAPDGDDLDSAIPDYGGRSLDAWFVADMRTGLPETLDEAVNARRHPPEYDEPMRAHRVKNRIELAIETAGDGSWSVEEGSTDLRTNEDEPPPFVAVEGQRGEANVVRRIIENPEMDWFEAEATGDRERADRLRAETDRFGSEPERIEVDGVEGVRAAVLYGGRDTYVTIMREKFYELGPAEFLERTGMDVEVVPAFVVRTPTMYTFLELAVMADGTTLARVWDTSRYPKHYLYVDGVKRRQTDFDEGERVYGGEWRKNETMNEVFGQWTMEEQDPRSPVGPNLPLAYERYADFVTSFGTRPAMSYGEDGQELTARQVALAQPPLFPW